MDDGEDYTGPNYKDANYCERYDQPIYDMDPIDLRDVLVAYGYPCTLVQSIPKSSNSGYCQGFSPVYINDRQNM